MPLPSTTGSWFTPSLPIFSSADHSTASGRVESSLWSGTITCVAVVDGHSMRGTFWMEESVTRPEVPVRVHHKVASLSGQNVFVHHLLKRGVPRNLWKIPLHGIKHFVSAEKALQHFLLQHAARGAFQEPPDKGRP